MRTIWMLAGLVVVLLAAPVAQAAISVELHALTATVNAGNDFGVDIIVSTDVALAAVQVVFDGLDPSLTLDGISAPLASLSFVNPPDTAAIDFFPNTEPAFLPGTFTVATLTFGTSSEGTFPLGLFLDSGSTLSTAVFDENYDPIWDLTTTGTQIVVTGVVIPEPASMGLLALVGIGGIIIGRKKRG